MTKRTRPSHPKKRLLAADETEFDSQRGRLCGSPTRGRYGAGGAALRRSRDPAGRPSNLWQR